MSEEMMMPREFAQDMMQKLALVYIFAKYGMMTKFPSLTAEECAEAAEYARREFTNITEKWEVAMGKEWKIAWSAE